MAIYGDESVCITIPSIDHHVNELWLFPIFLDCGYVSGIISFQTCGNEYILYMYVYVGVYMYRDQIKTVCVKCISD